MSHIGYHGPGNGIFTPVHNVLNCVRCRYKPNRETFTGDRGQLESHICLFVLLHTHGLITKSKTMIVCVAVARMQNSTKHIPDWVCQLISQLEYQPTGLNSLVFTTVMNRRHTVGLSPHCRMPPAMPASTSVCITAEENLNLRWHFLLIEFRCVSIRPVCLISLIAPSF